MRTLVDSERLVTELWVSMLHLDETRPQKFLVQDDL